MHDEVPDYEPAEITPGETLEWTKELRDFKAGEGWSLTYYFRNASGTGFDAAGTARGDSWEVTAEVPANAAAGRMDWQAWVETGGEKHLVGSGASTVKPSLSELAADAAYDGRSEVKKTLDAVDALLKGKATKDQQEYQIGNRMLRRIPLIELIELRKHYAALYAKERRRARKFLLTNIELSFEGPR